MQLFNIHTHTARCGHAVGKDEDYILAAIDSGIEVLGFSDHVTFKEYVFNGERMRFEDMEDYLQSMVALKEKYKEKIDIKIGFECEFFKDYLPYYRELLERVDYLILGHHNSFLGDQDYGVDAIDERVIQYADEVCEGLESGLFTYLAHPSYFMLGRDEWNSVCDRAMNQICECAKKNHVPLEINLKGRSYGLRNFKDGPSYVYPHKKAMPFFSKHQNDCIFGLDCHDPKNFYKMKEWMMDCTEEFQVFNLNFVETVPFVNPIKKR